MEAQCACGQLVVILPEDVTPAVVACHCTACQRRSGSPFGVGAYYPRALLSFSGDSRAWTRQADSGGAFTTHFCPVCGSSLYWTTEKHPDAVGIAVGALQIHTFQRLSGLSGKRPGMAGSRSPPPPSTSRRAAADRPSMAGPASAACSPV